MQYYEDFEVGQTLHSVKSHTMTEEEIIEFGIRWDSQPFHTDPVAAKASEFGGLVASSTHLFAISVGLWNEPDLDESERTAVISALGFNNIKLKLPARPGDVLTATSSVIDKRESRSRPGVGILVFHDTMRNQENKVVFEVENSALIKMRPFQGT